MVAVPAWCPAGGGAWARAVRTSPGAPGTATNAPGLTRERRGYALAMRTRDRLTGWDRAEITTVAGTRMHAAVLGRAMAPAVVCVHGLGCSHRYFLPVARCLGCPAPGTR
jgi:pimeloyl-ACP methyl ester carboxylesterase